MCVFVCNRAGVWRRFRVGASTATVACVALTAVLAVLVPGPALARPITPGVLSLSDYSPAAAVRLAKGGVRQVRMVFNWARISKVQRTFDFSYYDRQVGAAARAGQKILPVLIGSPSWQGLPPVHYPTDPEQQEIFARFAGHVAQRYGRGGSFWKDYPSLPYRPLTAYQVWNEPNVGSYSSGKTQPRSAAPSFAELVHRSATQLRKTDPRARIVLAGMPMREGKPSSVLAWHSAIAEEPHMKEDISQLAVHPYGKNPGVVLAYVKECVRNAREVFGRPMPMNITEIGYASSGAESILTRSERGQAEALGKIFTLLSEESAKLQIKSVFWYSLQDLAERDDTQQPWQSHSGLFYKDGFPKASWSALTDVLGGEDGGQGPLNPPPPEEAKDQAGH